MKKIQKIVYTLFMGLSVTGLFSQANMTTARRDQLSKGFVNNTFQYGVGLTLKVDLVQNTFGYYRLSLTGGVGAPFGKEVGMNNNYVALYYFAELDLFRGGMGAPALALDNQKVLMELRQSFLASVGSPENSTRFNYARPVVQFVSNSAHPLYDPFWWSATLGTTFVNGLNVRRSQRCGVFTVGASQFLFTYLNDGPPFSAKFLPLGDGFDRWWTGSGQVGWYDPKWTVFRSIEMKYDKFTGLQPYAYETSNSLRLKFIPYKSKEVQLLNRQRIEINFSTNRGLGLSYSFYDLPLLDIQHWIHSGQNYTYHNTPLKWRSAAGVFYTNTFHVN